MTVMRTKYSPVTGRSVLPLSLAAALTGSLGCAVTVDEPDDEFIDHADTSELENARARGDGWEIVRRARQAMLDRYLAEHAAELDAFLHRPLGASGVPAALMRAFPTVMPDIWGSASAPFSPQGFSFDPFKPDATLPLGLGTVTVAGNELVGLTCGGCHTGQVVGPDGKVITLVGAPNTRFNQLRTSIEDTVLDPRFAAFGTSPGVMEFKSKVLQARSLQASTQIGYTYNPARFPGQQVPVLTTRDKPGFLDPIGAAMMILTVPDIFTNPDIVRDVMGPDPAQIDIVSVWRQNARAMAQWDGSIANPVYRNLAASLGVIGNPALVDYENAKITADFAAELPPPPYPFSVDLGKAIEGGKHFLKHCYGCHKDDNATVYTPAQTGTDPGRTNSITREGRRRLILALRASCKDPAVCDVPDDQIIRDLGDVTKAGETNPARGYTAQPLDGIWARAPYLHNGAVPNLRALLLPATRPATFLRGSIRYDQKNVGFVSDDSALGEVGVHRYNTAELGNSRFGHDTSAFNGLDWSKEPKKLEELLEFLKTL
jgi:hypothetical protein